MAAKAQPFTILVALQEDETADQAMTEAFRLALTREETELHAVHVVPTTGTTKDGVVVALDAALEKAPKALGEIIHRNAPKDVDLKVIGHIRASAAPAHAILQMAIDISADTIIVGTHRRRGLEKLLLGSVAERVLRDAHCPVLVVVPKNYDGDEISPSITPPCPECLAVRKQSEGKTYWCPQHLRTYHEPHIYVPNPSARHSTMPTY